MPWNLRLLVQRSVGPLDRAFTSFELGYELPEFYTAAPPAAVQGSMAACDMQRRIAGDPDFALDNVAIRIGLHHGEALVEQGDVYGDAVNTAHRLLSVARPGEVLVGERTWLATRGAMEFESRPAFRVRGKRDDDRRVDDHRALFRDAGRQARSDCSISSSISRSRSATGGCCGRFVVGCRRSRPCSAEKSRAGAAR